VKIFKLELDLENDAFAADPHREVARILRETAGEIEEHRPGGRLLDVNGNDVGRWRFLGL